jgi:hypothetical protein
MFPCEIWKHEISSYLDTESRINLSRILKYDCRPIPRKITQEKITKHFAQSTCSALKSKLQKIIDIKKRSDKIVFIMEYFNLIQKKPIFCTILSEEAIREILLEKCEQYRLDNILYNQDPELKKQFESSLQTMEDCIISYM